MSKFSGQKRRRGKRRNRQETEGLDHDTHVSSAVPRNDLVGDSSRRQAEKGLSGPGMAIIGHAGESTTGRDGRFAVDPARNGESKSGASSDTLGSGSPKGYGLSNSPNSQDNSGRDMTPVGKEPDGSKKRLRRRTRRNRSPKVPLDAMASSSQLEGAGSVKGSFAQQSADEILARPLENETTSTADHPRKRRNTRRRGAKPKQGEEAVLRNMRSPVTPAPRVAYVPRPDVEEHGKDNKTQRQAGHQGKRSAYAKPRDNGLYAALDLGTNNCRLLVATPLERGKFRVVDGYSKIVRLGEGLAHSGRLSDSAMDRAVEALRICSEKLMSHPVRGYRLIATEACRQAENGSHFLSRVKSETGMDLEIIDRETEAYLAAEGCGALMDKKADAAVLFDIGGGSSELVLVNQQGRKKRISDQIVSWHSLPIGVVTLAERHGGAEVNKDIFQAMVEEVRDHLVKFEGRDALARIWKNGRVHLLGTSGTVTTLAGIHLGLPRYERRLVDGLWLGGSDIDRVIKDLLAMDYRQRAASPCIGTERADLVMAGCAILEGIRQMWPSDRLRVADRGLREGMLTQLMERDLAWLPPKAGRRRKNKFWKQGRSGLNGSADNRNGKV